jgi:hypothetical protein
MHLILSDSPHLKEILYIIVTPNIISFDRYMKCHDDSHMNVFSSTKVYHRKTRKSHAFPVLHDHLPYIVVFKIDLNPNINFFF